MPPHDLVPALTETARSTLDRAFAKFLDGTSDVKASSKLPEVFGFATEYTAEHESPLVLPRLCRGRADGSHWLLETKGQETPEVQWKDEAAQRRMRVAATR